MEDSKIARFKGNFVDIVNRSIYAVEIKVKDKRVAEINKINAKVSGFIFPGFIDAHVHIESAMLVPAVFARMAVVHGTVACVSDPHEIANILGAEGVAYMIENGKRVNFKFFFGVPSCVPATPFESAGAAITSEEVEKLLKREEVKYLAEMMNYPGVLNNEPEVMKKLAAARKHGKPVDGHAPGLRGEAAKKYISEGISTDHECYSYEEAKEKIAYGMKIIIREGSAAKNFEALYPLIDEYPDDIMFCSDDKHPDDLVESHINDIVRRAVAKGVNVFNALKAACINPVDHYKLPVGCLNPGDPADFVVVNNLKDFKVEKTVINGEEVAENGVSNIPYLKSHLVNNFNCDLKVTADFEVPAKKFSSIRVIVPKDGQLVTEANIEKANIEDGKIVANLPKDTLKIAVVNRYNNASPAMGFIKNFGLKSGAIASCVAHDSHNIIAVGVDARSICAAINEIIKNKGGICAVSENRKEVLPLPVAGIMSADDGATVARKYAMVDKMAKELGSTLKAPFMTLSFMALLVIPELKLSDKGLFDGRSFTFTESLLDD